MITTPAQILINEALPEPLRKPFHELDGKSIKELMRQVAQQFPEKYPDVVGKLNKLGHYAAQASGTSLSLKSATAPPEVKVGLERLRAQVQEVADSNLPDKQKNDRIIDMVSKTMPELEQLLMTKGTADGNPLAMQAVSGSRGNSVQFRQLVLGDGLVMDHRDNVIPVPILRGYASGLTPMEYWCLDGDTEVRMADCGVRRIRDILPGEHVLGADGSGRTFPVRVLNVWNNGQRRCHEFTYRVGRTRQHVAVTCTAEHKVLVSSDERGHRHEPPQVRPIGEAFAARWRAVPARETQSGIGEHEPRAFLLGLLLGDGYLPVNGSVVLSCADKGLISYLNDYLPTLGLFVSHRHAYSYLIRNCRSCRQDPETGQIHGCKRGDLKEWLAHLGLLGVKGPSKFVPAVVFGWDRDSVAAFLSGLFVADGCISSTSQGSPCLKFCSTSEALIEGVRKLLQVKFGVFIGRPHVRPASDHPIRRGSGVVRAIVNRHALRSISVACQDDVIRLGAELVLHGCKEKRLAKLIEGHEPRRRMTSSFFPVGFRECGLRETFDLEVDHPDHLFVLASGLVVSNSGSYGARKGSVSTKLGTAQGGFLNKQLVMAVHRSVITQDDCGTTSGIRVPASDGDNAGAVLAGGAGDLKPGTILSPKDLKGLGDAEITVRSPLTCQATEGICARCAGSREKGRLPDVGDNIGIPAAQAIGEKVSQGLLSSKHSGGVVGASAPTRGGFKSINQLVQVPESFQGGATLASLDGHVEKITDAPQGGKYVTIGKTEHYVSPDQQVTVKAGQKLEAGDLLSDGVPNPSEITNYKGLGEGRQAFMRAFKDALKASNVSVHRRNLEVLARGLVNHVRITDPDGFEGFLPEDVVTYDEIRRAYRPREGAGLLPPSRAVGQYLEAPAMHYTVGTRVTPSVAKRLADSGVTEVTSHSKPPPFEPIMVRAMESGLRDPNPLTRMQGSYLSKGLLESVHRGRSAKRHDTSFIPALVEGSEFGDQLSRTGKY